MSRALPTLSRILCLTLCTAANSLAQDSAPPSFNGATAFPSRPKADPANLARGKEIYKTNCAYCHGEDARGGESGGTNLLRSDILIKDKNGEVLGQFLLNPRETGHQAVREGVLKFSLTPDQASDVAAFIHDFRLSSRDAGRKRPKTIVVGDAKAGEQYFQEKCASCHSVTGDLQNIASRFPDAQTLQQTWLMPAVYGFRGFNPPSVSPETHVPPITVSVTLPNGQKVDGRLGRIDDFIVTLTQSDGSARSFRRDGSVPEVELHDPMKPHHDLLPMYTDKDIHDVTAYLVTIK